MGVRFPEKLNRLMKDKRLKGKQIAEAIGVSDNAVSRWRNGQTFPRSIELMRLARLLGVTMEWLIEDEEGGWIAK